MSRQTLLALVLSCAGTLLILRHSGRGAHHHLPEPRICSAVAAVGPTGASPELLLPTLVTPGSLAIDIGANVGQTAKELAGAGARVLSFEPNPAACASFLAATANLSGVDLVCAALGEASGLATFVDSPSGSTSFMQAPEGRAGAVGRVVTKEATGGTIGEMVAYANAPAGPKMHTIPIVTLDAVLAARGLPEVQVLKSDTQGREWAALHGATTAVESAQHVVVEFSFGLLAAAGTDQARFVRWLAERGLTCFYMDKHAMNGKVEWPEGMGECMMPSELVAAVKGGWTNLWCRRTEHGGSRRGGLGRRAAGE